jgi:hypothetical protein
MVLVDTSVWVSHLRAGDAGLAALLNDARVACHPFVVGELACGSLGNREEILSLLQSLPMAARVEHEEVMGFMEKHRLMARGLGYIDMHLLASALLSNIHLWTHDRKLRDASMEFELAYVLGK